MLFVFVETVNHNTRNKNLEIKREPQKKNKNHKPYLEVNMNYYATPSETGPKK